MQRLQHRHELVGEGAVEDRAVLRRIERAVLAPELDRILRREEGRLEGDPFRGERRLREGDDVEVETIADQQHARASIALGEHRRIDALEDCSQRVHLSLRELRIEHVVEDALLLARHAFAERASRSPCSGS